MSINAGQRKLAAIMFTDMVGYSALSQRDDKLALELLEEHRELLREIFPRFHGTEIKTIGDGFLVEFHSALEATQCAVEIQRALSMRNEDVPLERCVEVRIGVHIGDVVHRNGDVYGNGVNIASRIERLAGAGGICVSMDVERQIRNALDVRLEKLAPTELKNISMPMDLFRIVLPWEQRAAVVEKTEPVSKSSRRKFLPTVFGLALLFVIGVGWWWITLSRKTPTSAPTALRITSPREKEASPANVSAKSIAILPFENLSEEKTNAYFAEGVQNEILTKLSTVRDLKVISRTSTAKYQSKPENLKTVAQELGVSNILEGAVQRASDKVRVNVQLIDAQTDTHLWAKSYDRELKDLLSVESEVAEEITDALKANLSPGESNVMAAPRTQNTEAYDLFLRGEYELHQGQSSLVADAFDRADAFYRQALTRDPNFAQAAAALTYARLYRHWFLAPLTPQQLDEVKSIIDRALTVAPDSPEAHFALGLFFYWRHRQYDKALAEFNRTLELQPNNALARQFCGWVYRRRGEWERAIADVRRAEELDPRDPQIPANLGAIYAALRLWKDAERAELRALAIDPHNVVAADFLARFRLNASGDIKSAWRALDGVPEEKRISARSFQGDVAAITGISVYLDVIERRFTYALQAFETGGSNGDIGRPQQLAGRAVLQLLAGQTESTKSAGEAALPLLEARLRERPDDTFATTQLAWVYLALRRNADALRLAREAAASIPIQKDAVSGPAFQVGLAQVEARAGAADDAIKRLRLLLSIPAGDVISIALLKIDPIWDPIRDRPDFQQLLSGTELIGPNK